MTSSSRRSSVSTTRSSRHGRGRAAGDAARDRRRLRAGEHRASGHSQGRVAAGFAHAALRRCERLNLALRAVALVASAAALASVLIYVLRPMLRPPSPCPSQRALLPHRTPRRKAPDSASCIALLIICAAAWLLWQAPVGARRSVPALAAALGLMVLGLADDAHALPVSWRFIGQTLAALVMVLSLPEDLRLFPGLLPLVVERACSCLARSGSSTPSIFSTGSTG